MVNVYDQNEDKTRFDLVKCKLGWIVLFGIIFVSVSNLKSLHPWKNQIPNLQCQNWIGLFTEYSNYFELKDE